MQNRLLFLCFLVGLTKSEDLSAEAFIESTTKRAPVPDYMLRTISQQLFDADKNDFLSNVKINFQGYLNNSKICRQLNNIELSKGINNIPENMIKCYKLLTEGNLIGLEEMKLLETWSQETLSVLTAPD